MKAIPGHLVDSARERLLARRLITERGCWEYTGCCTPRGYGNIKVGKVSFGAHQLAFAVFRGPVADGQCVCHHCDNPPCFNPEHLFIGTQKENLHDCISKGRNNARRGESVKGAKLTTEDVQRLLARYAELVALREAMPFVILEFEFPQVKRHTLRKIAKGKRWKHVQPESLLKAA